MKKNISLMAAAAFALAIGSAQAAPFPELAYEQ
jgi:hypothetical protein